MLSALGMKPGATHQGLAPFGLRHDGGGAKGMGYMGRIPALEGDVATEISSENSQGAYPLLVPTLTRAQVGLLASGGAPDDDIYNAAESYAQMRRQRGLSPFASPAELRVPVGLLGR